MTSISGVAGSGSSSRWLAWADRNFRIFGKFTLALLLTTAGLLAVDISAWRAVFASAHAAALVALVPLGVVLVSHAFRQARLAGDPGLAGILRRYRVVAILLAVTVVTVALSLANFEGGSRVVRRIANLTTVGIALVLVWRYLAWARTNLRR